MLIIRKRPAPPGPHQYLKEHPEDANYEDFKDYNVYQNKNDQEAFFELRAQLLREQGYTCAYCGQKLLAVENDNGLYQMKTEHFIPQNGTKENDLNYSNLIACCLGGERDPGPKHCDTHKNKTALNHLKNPAICKIRDRGIKYRVRPKSEEVVIYSDDDEKDRELNKVLNLNHDRLRRRRFSVWKVQIEQIIGRKRKLKELRDEYTGTPRGHHKEFKDFIQWYVEDQLRRGK